MRLVRVICRFVFGLTFILSGFLKALDPVGFSLKIGEYFSAFGLSFFSFLNDPLALLIPIAEFVIGVAILKGLKPNVFSKVALAFIGFFTFLTLVIALFDPIEDCGCFGELISLTNWETFFKNVVLLGLAVIIYFSRDKFKQIARNSVQWIYIGIYAIIISGVALYSYVGVPFIDFGLYSPGTDLVEAQGQMQEKEYETIFIYQKDGVEESFTLDNLPDSSWVYVDSKTNLISGDDNSFAIDFALKDLQGEYVQDNLLSKADPVFFVSYYEDEDITVEDSIKLATYANYMEQLGGELYVLAASPDYQVAKVLPYKTFFADYKTLVSFNRSNGGLTYLANGVIVYKWAWWNFPEEMDDILAVDYEVITVVSQMKQRILFSGFLVVVFLLIFIVRTVSVIVHRLLHNKGLVHKKKDSV